MNMTFTKEAWDTLKAYFAAAYQQLGDLELQGYGRVRMEDGEPVCFEVGIPEQEVSVAKTDATWDQMLEFLQEKIDFKNVKRAKLEVPSWRLWWHTHGTSGGFGVTYSGTDEATLKALAKEAGDWMWGLVFYSDTMDSTLYLATQQPITLYAELGKAIYEVDAVDVPEDIAEEVELKVIKKVYKTASVLPGVSSQYKPGSPNYGHPFHCMCIVCKKIMDDEDDEDEGLDLPNGQYLGMGQGLDPAVEHDADGQ